MIAKEQFIKDGISAAKRTSGFTLVELVVVIGIIIALVAVSIPAISTWLPNYKLKGAAMDLYASMQFAKSEAIRANRPYAVFFDPGSGTYSLVSAPGNDGTFGTGDTNETVVDEIRVLDYGPNIAFGKGNATANFEDGGGTFPGDFVSYDELVGERTDNVVVFNGRGLCNSGSVYLQNSSNRTYVVGTLMSGIVRIKRWSDGSWQ